MEKLTFRERLKNTFLRPRQLILLDSHGGRPARSLNIRIIVLIIVILAVILGSFIAGALLLPIGNNRSLIPQHLQLQRQYNQLQSDMAEANAENDLKSQQLEGLKEELLQQQDRNGKMAQRLRMLESILEARKANGLHLLDPQLLWLDAKSLQYDLTLVKGGSYPRFIAGSAVLSAQSPEGETVEIKLGKQTNGLPFRIETHTFLRGQVDWEYDWHPKKLTFIAYSRRGKELIKSELSIDGVPK